MLPLDEMTTCQYHPHVIALYSSPSLPRGMKCLNVTRPMTDFASNSPLISISASLSKDALRYAAIWQLAPNDVSSISRYWLTNNTCMRGRQIRCETLNASTFNDTAIASVAAPYRLKIHIECIEVALLASVHDPNKVIPGFCIIALKGDM